MAAPAKKPFSDDMADAILEAMLLNPEHADAIAKLSNEELRAIDESVPEDDEEVGPENDAV